MKTIEELLKNLARPEVLEFGLVTNRLPSVNIGGKFEPVDDEAPSTERLMQMLVTMGGSRYIDSLTDKPVQWTTRLDGVGVIAVAAILRKDVVQARFTVAKRESGGAAVVAPAARASTMAMPAHRAAEIPVASPTPRPVTSSAKSAAQPGSGPARAAQPGAATAKLAPAQVEQPAPIQPQVIKSVGASSGQVRVATSAAPVAPAPPGSDEEWDDDDEPTLQTVSPPLTTAGGEPRPKPARHAVAASQPEAKAPNPGAQPRAAQEKVQDKIAQATQELVRVREQRALQERQARERAEAAARPKATAEEPRPRPRPRISTPTSIDAVDVEIATQHSGAKPAPIAIDLEADSGENARPVPSDVKAPAAKPVSPTGAFLQVADPDVPVDRPRIDPAASIDAFVALAVTARASDLHIIAGRPAALRVGSDLRPSTQAVPPEQVERLLKEIVPPRLRDVLDREGACDFAIEHPVHGRFRVNASRQRTGFKLSLRVIPKEPPTLAALGLPEGVAKALAPVPRSGLILVTGTAAQGKSTTLAALVDHVNRETTRHIVTIEEPLEHVHSRKKSLVSQREVGLHTRAKARAIHGALQEDADVVVVSELNDIESIRAALVVAESGRLVLATMSAPSASSAIERIASRFPTAERARTQATLSSVLRLIIGQRLVPSVDRTRFHVAVELVPWSVALYTLIRSGQYDQLSSLKQRGIVRLHESLAELVRAQKVTAEVASQCTGPSSDLENPMARPAVAAQARK